MENQVQSVADILPLFDIHQETYKQVEDQPIGVHIFVPRDAPFGKRPVLVKIHGGAFVEGNSSDWWRPWTLELALKHKAIIVSTDYRLMPESKLSDILEDIQDFWNWLSIALPKLPYANVDLTNLALLGESAGGFLAVQSLTLGWANDIKPRALLLQYPAGLDPSTMAAALKTYSPTGQVVPLSILEDHLAQMSPGKILTRTPFGTRMPLLMAILQHGKLADYMLAPPEVSMPMKSLEMMKGQMPPVFVLHGKVDMHMNWESSRNWAEKLKTLQPEVPVCCVFREGEPHVLDREVTLETEWMKEPAQFIEKYWPAKA